MPHAATPVPVIETERLTLRGHTPDDFYESAGMWADPLVTRHIGGRPFTAEESWMRLLRYGGLWPLLGYGYWVLRERESGRFAGEVGFADFRREMAPPLGRGPEAGWVLAGWAHGRGFATEALRAALAWRDAHVPGSRTVCIVAPANTASLHVARKCGFHERRRAALKGEETFVCIRERA